MRGTLHLTDPVGVPTGSALSLTAEDVRGLVVAAKTATANPHIKASPAPQTMDGKAAHRLWDEASSANDGLPVVVGLLIIEG